MKRQKLRLQVLRDTCLGHEVFRGSAPARQLVEASWIDFHDRINNRYGYQRPFDKGRSRKAREYADTQPEGFWPECVLAIRDNSEVDEDDEKVDWTFTARRGTDGRFGVLEVSYNPEGSTLINGQHEAWRRAFAQVDCQHRLGSMGGSDKLVTFCIFPRLTRRQEAVIFRTINARQRKISTSLVDAIILLTDPNPPVHIVWARDLGEDPGSPFNAQVWTGGRERPPAGYLVTLTGLRRALEVLAPKSLVRDSDPDTVYVFMRNFWLVVRDLWPDEFKDRDNYKLQSNPGLGGLAQFGRHVSEEMIPLGQTTQEPIRAAFADDPSRIDWSVGGEFRLATGKGGQRNVHEALVREYGLPK